MNDDYPLDEHDLLLATSRHLPLGAALDPDTAALRDSFLALGTALEAAGKSANEKAILQAMQKASTVSRTPSSAVSAKSAAHFPALVYLAALAAVALVAFVSMVAFRRVDPPAIVVANVPSGSLSTAPPAYNWHDPLDDEIELAAVGLNQLSARPPSFDDSLLDMNQELIWLSQELSSGSL